MGMAFAVADGVCCGLPTLLDIDTIAVTVTVTVKVCHCLSLILYGRRASRGGDM